MVNHGELGRRAAGYHSSRAEAVQSVQKTIGELAQMFQKCLGMARCGAWWSMVGARFFESVYHHNSEMASICRSFYVGFYMFLPNSTSGVARIHTVHSDVVKRCEETPWKVPFPQPLVVLSNHRLPVDTFGGLETLKPSYVKWNPACPYLIGGLEHFLFFHSVGNVIIPTDFHSIIFQRGRLNHQPDTCP